MFKRISTFLVAGSGLLHAVACDISCTSDYRPMRLSVDHVEGKGIGFNEGYSSLDLFLSHDFSNVCFLPFINGKAHIFNDGKWAFNSGIGARGLWNEIVFGGYAYYDYRNGNRSRYNQISAGFEALGNNWEFHINGYYPLGRTQSAPYRPTFDKFQGNSIFVKRKYELAMKGGNAEFGGNFGRYEGFEAYAGIGPYYFTGDFGKSAVGGKARLIGRYKQYVSIEVINSYDSLFHNRVQGTFTLSYPFGKKLKGRCKEGKAQKTPCLPYFNKLVQPVEKQDIIVLDTQKKSKATSSTVYFVKNTSNSLGTFESPYSNLSEAIATSSESDLIYVYAGDSTATGLTATATPFQLKDNQQLLGAATAHDFSSNLGDITIPTHDTIAPYLSASANVSVIKVADGNTVSGFLIDVPGGASRTWAIGSDADFHGLTISHNTITGRASNIYLVDLGNGTGCPSGHVVIKNNSIASNAASTYAIFTDHPQPNTLELDILNNNLTNASADIIRIDSSSGTINATINKNTFTNSSSGDAVDLNTIESAEMNIDLNENTIAGDQGFDIDTRNNSSINMTIKNNNLIVQDESLFALVSHQSKLTITSENNIYSSHGDSDENIDIDIRDRSIFVGKFTSDQMSIGSSGSTATAFRTESYQDSRSDVTLSYCTTFNGSYDSSYAMYIAANGNSHVTSNINNCVINALDGDDSGEGLHIGTTTNGIMVTTIHNNTIDCSDQGMHITSSGQHMKADIQNNIVRLSNDADTGIDVSASNSSGLELTCISNTMIGETCLSLTNSGSGNFSGRVEKNIVKSSATNNAIDINASSSAVLDLVFDRNTIYSSVNSNAGNGAIDIDTSATSTLKLEFTNNTVTSTASGIDATIAGTSTFTSRTSNNTYDTINGDKFTTQNSASACVNYQSNKGRSTNAFTNSGGGAFTLFYSDNNQSEVRSGTITDGTSESCKLD